MAKVVISTDIHGFQLTVPTLRELALRKRVHFTMKGYAGKHIEFHGVDPMWWRELPRHDTDLVAERRSDARDHVKIVEVPDG